jgi:molybdate transport system permease protein
MSTHEVGSNRTYLKEAQLDESERLDGRLDQRTFPRILSFRKDDLWKMLALPLLLFLALPLVALFTRLSTKDILDTLRQPQVLQAIGLSLFTSSIATLLSFLFGLPVAYLLAHYRGRFYHAIDTLVDLPTILPPAVAGVALLMAFGRRGLIGAAFAPFGISLPYTQAAVIMAQMFVASPFFIKAAAVGFTAIGDDLNQAASLDGANTTQIFRYVSLPLAGFSILSGCVMTWARALGEFGATIIFAGNFPGRTQTMPLAIYLGFEINLDAALTLSLILICASFTTLILVKGFLQRRVALEA